MAALDFPASPNVNDVYLAANGINYIWDGTKWTVYVDPTTANNVWQRDGLNLELSPINDGDSVVVTNSGGSTTITLADDGGITATGVMSAAGFDIDSLPVLP